AFNLFLARTFPNYPYGRSPEGETASVTALDAEKAKNFFFEHYPASALSFVAVGGPPSGQLASTFSYSFNGLSNGTFTPVPLPETSPLSGIATASVETGPSAVVLGSSGPDFTQFRQGVALDLLAIILKRALSGEGEDCLSWWDFRRGSGLFAIAFKGDRKTIDKMSERTLIVLENVRNGSFSPDELSRAQDSLLAALEGIKGNDLARQLGFFNTLGSPVALDTYPPVVRQITPAEIQEAAQRWLGPSRIVVAKVYGK
ncbi:MAG TPA: insulinase family protein, partial [Chroococcales cyanobacterium]